MTGVEEFLAPGTVGRDHAATFAGAALVGLAGLVLAEILGQHPIIGLLAGIALHQFAEPIVVAQLRTAQI